MRMLMIAVALLFGAGALGGCIIRPVGYGPRHRVVYRSEPQRCATRCGAYGHRRICQRRCSVWRNGVCVRYVEACRNEAHCQRQVTRCR